MRKKFLFSSLLMGLLFWIFTSFSLADEAATGGPVAFFPESRYTFQQALEGTELLHDFVIVNKGDSLLEVQEGQTRLRMHRCLLFETNPCRRQGKNIHQGEYERLWGKNASQDCNR